VVLRVEGRRLQGTVRRSDRLDDDSLRMEVEPSQAPLFPARLLSAMGALAAFMGAFLAVLMVLGAGFTAIMLAVAGNRMLTEFAGTFWTIADTFAVDHDSDSFGMCMCRIDVTPLGCCCGT
jgi:hypothetical protein